MTNAVVGVDVGGTFTDLVLMDQDTGEVRIAKVPTTPENQAFGVLNAVAAAGIAHQPWHYHHDQRHTGAQDCAVRAHHHSGLSRCTGAWSANPPKSIWTAGAL
jgi:hypothetical protein